MLMLMLAGLCLCWCAVARIALVKPDKARGVENMILNAGKRGQLGEKVNERDHHAHVVLTVLHPLCLLLLSHCSSSLTVLSFVVARCLRSAWW